jgi:hypothetical protein
MDVRPRHIALFAGLSIVAAIVLWVVLEAAGRPVALAVAIGAIVALVAGYVWCGVLLVRSFDDKNAHMRARLRRSRALFPMMFGTPLVVIAAHPWGKVSVLIGTGAVVLCQFLFAWTITIAFLVLRRRPRTAPPG